MYEVKNGIKTSVIINNKGKNVFQFRIMPERGIWITFEINESKEITVRIDAGKKTPLHLFLTVFENKRELISEELLDIFFPYENNKEKRLNIIQSMFFNKDKYHLAKIDREKLNNLIYPMDKSRVYTRSHTLLKKDILAIERFLKRKMY